MKKIILLLLFFLPITDAFSTTIYGDTQGVVSNVLLRPSYDGVYTARIYFKSIDRDRFGCLTGSSAQGYLEFSDESYAMTTDHFHIFYSTVVTALLSGNTIAVDSLSANSPCNAAVQIQLLSE